MKSDYELSKVLPELASRWRKVRQGLFDLTGIQIRITEGYRSPMDQMKLFQKGRSKRDGIWVVTDPKQVVTNALPFFSYHQFGLALDSCFMGSDPYLTKHPKQIEMWDLFGKEVQKTGMKWGGEFKLVDRPHCEMSFGYCLDTLRMTFEDGGLQKVWAMCMNAMHCGRQIQEG